MKKKIKDLTFFEVNEICSKRKRCSECPLYISGVYEDKRCIMTILYRAYNNEWTDIIEQEVDI